jgi:cytoskeletal protein CcmA (bactofilin family)
VHRPRAAPDEFHYRADLPDLDPVRSEPRPANNDIAPSLDGDLDAPSLPALPAVDMQTSVIAHTTSWSGNLESSGSLHVHGRVEGSLSARDDVFIAEEAEIDAVVSASRITVAGSVRGSIHCAERFEVLPRGRVVGDVRAPLIVVHEGALIAGDIAMSKPAAGESQTTHAHSVAARAARGGD